MRDVGDQLRAYGEALERSLVEAEAVRDREAGAADRAGGRRRLVLALAAAVLVAVAAWGLLAPDPGTDELRTHDAPARPGPTGPPDAGVTTSTAPPLGPAATTAPGGGDRPAGDPAAPPAPTGPAAGGSGGPPGPDSTGPTDPAALVPVTAEQVEAMMRPGAVIENVAISGGNLDVLASDVTLRNFTLDAGGAAYGIRSCGPDEDCGTPADQTTGLVVEDGEIHDLGATGFWGREATLRRLDVHDSDGTALRPIENVTVEASWWHHLGRDGGSANGVLFGEAGGRAVTIRGNHCDLPVTVEAPYGSSSCVIAGTGSAGVTVAVVDNWLNGGNNTVECTGNTAMTVAGNRFGRDLRYRPVSRCPAAADNVWDDTGEPI